MTDRFWHRWLVAATIVVAVVGATLVAAPAASRSVLALVLFGSATALGELGARAQPYLAFAHGVLGAVMLGWATLILLTVLGPFRRREWEAWRNLSVSLLAWLVPDTLLSVAAGFERNALLNAGLAVLFAIPLAATYRSFRSR